MSWHFSLALVEAFSEASSWDGGPSAPWKSSPSVPDDSCSDKMKGTCHLSPFGTMFVPSTDEPGLALLTWYRQASPATTPATPAGDPGLPASTAAFSLKPCGPSPRSRLAWSSSRTLRTVAVTGCALHGKDCSASVLIPSRPTLQLATSELDTFDGVAGYLPTPVADDTGWRKAPYKQGGRALSYVLGGPVNPEYSEWLMGWPMGWTGVEPLDTARMQEWSARHGISSQNEFSTEPLRKEFK